MRSIFQYLIFTLTLYGHVFGKIGDLTVHKTSPLVLNKWQLVQCKELLPHAISCDKAYKEVEDYCQTYAKKIDKECDESYAKLKESCNKAENKIKNDCKESNGYVTAKCGRNFDRLEKVCRIASETISRSCTEQYKKMDNVCNKKYGKCDLKCNRIYEEYKDMCESNLEENVWFDEKVERATKLNEIEEKVEEIKEVSNLDLDDKQSMEKKAQIFVNENKPKPIEKSTEEFKTENNLIQKEVSKPSVKSNEQKKTPIFENEQEDIEKSSEDYEFENNLDQKEVAKPSIKSSLKNEYTRNQQHIEKKVPMALNENNHEDSEKSSKNFEPESNFHQKKVAKPSIKSNLKNEYTKNQQHIEKKVTMAINENKQEDSEKSSEDFEPESNFYQKEVSNPSLKSKQQHIEKKVSIAINENQNKNVEKSSEDFELESNLFQKKNPKLFVKSNIQRKSTQAQNHIEKKTPATTNENKRKSLERVLNDFKTEAKLMQKKVIKPSMESNMQNKPTQKSSLENFDSENNMNMKSERVATNPGLNEMSTYFVRKPNLISKSFLEDYNRKRELYAKSLQAKKTFLKPAEKYNKKAFFDNLERQRSMLKKVSNSPKTEPKDDVKFVKQKEATGLSLPNNRAKYFYKRAPSAKKTMPESGAKSFMDKLYKEFDLEQKQFE